VKQYHLHICYICKFILSQSNIMSNANTQEKSLCTGNLLWYTRDTANFIFSCSAKTDWETDIKYFFFLNGNSFEWHKMLLETRFWWQSYDMYECRNYAFGGGVKRFSFIVVDHLMYVLGKSGDAGYWTRSWTIASMPQKLLLFWSLWWTGRFFACIEVQTKSSNV
jgi:hypothetical protein